jgi:hypothetical protein
MAATDNPIASIHYGHQTFTSFKNSKNDKKTPTPKAPDTSKVNQSKTFMP